jgi:hypothetical protein
MSAGTVISGGFPGRVAQEVQPNAKCNGCLHFDGQAGRTGVCTIGLRPWLCGEDGSAADIGYAPIARGAGSYLPDMNNHGAHASSVAPQESADLYGVGSTRPVAFQEVSLGEEHVRFVKSVFANHVTQQREMCRMCKSIGTTIGTGPANNGPQVCTCEPIEARSIAKSLIPRLSNRERLVIDLSDATDFVYSVIKGDGIAKGTFYHHHGKYEVSPSGKGQQHVDFHPRGGGETTRVGTFDTHKEARRASEHHARRFAHGTGAENKPYEHSNAAPTHTAAEHTVRAHAGAKEKPKSTHTPAGLPSMKEAVSVVGKSETAVPHVSHFKSPHGNYKVESNHSTGEHTVHYTPKAGAKAPAQSVKMPSHEHAVKMAKVHAFVNDHDGEHSHATMHHDHVAVHEPHSGPDGGAATHKVTSMGSAREHLGY